MKVDVYCVLMSEPRRFGMKTPGPLTFNKVVALPEMTDGQVVRQAVDNTCFFLESWGQIGVQVDIHLDDPPSGFKSGFFVPKFGDGYDEQLAESIARLKALLASPRDLQFKRSPNGGNLI